jgi:hypothetical protein
MKSNYIHRLTIELLSKNELAKDDMMLCVRYIHDFEMTMFGIKKKDYYKALFGGRLSSIKTLDRSWRRVQQENPSLRGSEWLDRQIQAGLAIAPCPDNETLLF